MLWTVIFSIDEVNTIRGLKQFTRFVDNLAAVGKLVGVGAIPCIGSYKGKLEQSFVMDVDDFEQHVESNGFVTGQDSFLYVQTNHRGVSYASLVYNAPLPDLPLGKLLAVDKSVALKCDSWTYRPDQDQYYVTGVK